VDEVPEPGEEETRKAELNRPGVEAIVQCPGFSCLACCDEKGIWHESESGAVLPNVTKILDVTSS
jgi:hypothetical protein